MKKIKNWLVVLFVGLPFLFSGCMAAVPVLAVGAAAGAAAGIVSIVNLARDQYPDIDFQKTAPVEVIYAENYDRVWDGVIDTIMQMKESTAMMDKNSGIIRTNAKNINDVSWIGKGLGKATFLYELNITVRRKQQGVSVSVMIPFWEEKVFVAKKEKNLPEGSNMVRHIFYHDLNQRLTPKLERMPDSPMHDIRYTPESMQGQYSEETTDNQNGYSNTTQSINAQGETKHTPDNTTSKVQAELTRLGYSPGPIDGIMGRKTRKAIQQFQRDKNIQVTGNPDDNTLIALGLKKGQIQYLKNEDGKKNNTSSSISNSEKMESIDTNTPKASQKEISSEDPTQSQTNQTIGKGKIIETTSILTKPSFMGTLLKEISAGQIVEVLDKENEFYKVKHNKAIGYVYNEFIQLL